MTAMLLPMLIFQPLQQSLTTGQMVPIPGGKLWCYAAGTLTPQAVYSDPAGLVPLSNPVILDASGIAQIYMGNLPYKFLLTDSLGTTIYPYPIDNVVSLSSLLTNQPTYAEVQYATAAQTVFNLSNSYIQGINSLAVFQNGARLIVGLDYLETSVSSITLLTAATVNDVFLFCSAKVTSSLGLDGSIVTYTPTVGAPTNIQAQVRNMSTFVTLTYGASIAVNAALGSVFLINATNNTVFTIQALTNPVVGQEITITIKNTAGVALGAITWPALFKMAAWTSPATGFNRSISLYYNGTNWVEFNRTTVDIPN